MHPRTLTRVRDTVVVLVPTTLFLTAAVGARPGSATAQDVNGEGDAAVELAPAAVNPELERAATVTASTEAALKALSKAVKRASDREALRTAFRAYFNYRLANAELVRNPYLYYVDLGLNNQTARGYVFDMDALKVVDGPFMVSHGRGSARPRDGVPTRFSNRAGSKASSLGVYLAQGTYRFSGRSAGVPYTSVGLRMRGESGAFNNAALSRGIVAHGAPYVTAKQAGRSEGCPAMEQHRAKRLLPLIANGGIIFIYSPNDPRWLRDDPWL